MASVATAGDLKGDYLETRTCDVYTGPASPTVKASLTGKDAIMAWSIDQGTYDEVDLSGLKVVVVLTASDTLGFGGTLVVNPEPIKSVIIVYEQATPRQRDARAVRRAIAQHAGQVVKVVSAPIEMSVDHFEMVGKLVAGNHAEILTRKLGTGDCVCSNEKTFYPPLCKVRGAAPAFTVEGGYSGPGLGPAGRIRTRSRVFGQFFRTESPAASGAAEPI